jgi:hypothetical protein
MSDTIELISPHNALVVSLRPPDMDWDQRTGYRVIKPGIKVRFVNGRARVNPETWAILKETSDYTGVGGRRRVWRADEMLAPHGGTQVVQGALGTISAPSAAKAPTQDWDSTGGVALAKRISSGELKVDYEAAFAYEMGKARRKTVIRALTDAMLDGPSTITPEPAGPEPVVLPADTEGV